MSDGPTDSTLGIGLLAAAAPRRRNQERLEDDIAQLFEQWRAALLRYLSTFGSTQHDNEEIVQEVFLALFSHLQKDKARTNLRAWLFRVAHNLALKHRNAGGRAIDAQIDVRHLTDRALNPEQEFASNQRYQRLNSIFRALPEQDRRCLSLRAEGLRYREIADVLGISLGSVALSLERSLAKFQRVDQR